MKKVGLRRILAALVGTVILATGGTVKGLAAGEEQAVVSYGLQVLSAATDVAASAPIGNEVVFSAELFARGLNLSKVDSITLKTLPDTVTGELLLGATRVAAGQTVSAKDLQYMTFCPALEEPCTASFLFTVNGGSTPLVCNVYLMNELNYTPTVSIASGLSLNISTYRDMQAHGTLSAYDPDGDSLIFEVVSYPQNGYLKLTDQTLGTYVYTPYNGYLGTDSFTYVARDRYGNYSASATVSLRVESAGTSVRYVDMADSKAQRAAIALTEAGVMSGTQVGEQYYFYPDKTVSRAEFLVMAMHAAGITQVPEDVTTVFADDADIPETMRGYVAAAYELRYISGNLENGKLCFLPNEPITRAQAAVILSNIVGLCDVAVIPTFADRSEIPVWASEAIYSLHAAGIMNSDAGYISPVANITRAQSAQMLAAVMEYVK